MPSRSHRVLQRLEELLPIARALLEDDEKIVRDHTTRLMQEVQKCLLDDDWQLLQALLESLRAEGLSEVWQFCWDKAIGFACEKAYTNHHRTVLVGLPLLPAWSGTCTAADRKKLTKVLKDQRVLAGKAKLDWFPKPQSIHRLRTTNPVTLWRINTPEQPAPYWWNLGHEFTPGLQVLVGRIELPPREDIHWPDLEGLRNAMTASLGWDSRSLGYLAPLQKFLELDAEELQDPVEQMLTELGFSIRHALQHWLAEEPQPQGGCSVLLEAAEPGTLEVYAQAKGRKKTKLCRVEYSAPSFDRERILDRVRLIIGDLGVSVLWSVPSTKGGPGMLH